METTIYLAVMIKLNHKHRIMQGELEENWSDRLCKCNPFFPRQDWKGAGVIGSSNAILEGMEGGYLPLYDMLLHSI